MAEDFSELFSRIRVFDWNPTKRETNLREKKIDFIDAKGVFDGPTYIRRSDRHGEIRYQVFGYLEGREVAVICTIRGVDGEICWLISARRAHRSERGEYYSLLTGRSQAGQD